ncbi:hypothetical protein CLE01_08870 [Cryobacterium levicorallinum]|nr:hypothetical protein CLE01_08870 [Cryobacterium levicorallinum]
MLHEAKSHCTRRPTLSTTFSKLSTTSGPGACAGAPYSSPDTGWDVMGAVSLLSGDREHIAVGRRKPGCALQRDEMFQMGGSLGQSGSLAVWIQALRAA